MSEQGEWWCPDCKQYVDGLQVTFSEVHELCGHPVEWITFPDKSEIEKLRHENVQLKKELLDLKTVCRHAILSGDPAQLERYLQST